LNATVIKNVLTSLIQTQISLIIGHQINTFAFSQSTK